MRVALKAWLAILVVAATWHDACAALEVALLPGGAIIILGAFPRLTLASGADLVGPAVARLGAGAGVARVECADPVDIVLGEAAHIGAALVNGAHRGALRTAMVQAQVMADLMGRDAR